MYSSPDGWSPVHTLAQEEEQPWMGTHCVHGSVSCPFLAWEHSHGSSGNHHQSSKGGLRRWRESKGGRESIRLMLSLFLDSRGYHSEHPRKSNQYSREILRLCFQGLPDGLPVGGTMDPYCFVTLVVSLWFDWRSAYNPPPKNLSFFKV